MLDLYGRDVNPKFNGSVYLTQLTRGNEANSPRPGPTCEIHARGYCDGKVLEGCDVSFAIGDFEEVGVPEGLDSALCYMSEGEEARVRICDPMTFTSCESAKCGIPENMEHVQSLKQKASEPIKAGIYQIAVDIY
ncbi:unnamed protein product [Hydatigera taeniaeformis]|uniref:peptidylprolyl isomerase n=1 Tax=Hydatigena taeniaeformis TaxID=6205 RepID=A0A3P7GKM2_HYDTA|nr:unnamed protein product [Hydatigera taeniaeformis]